jgi:hypothetical protein
MCTCQADNPENCECEELYHIPLFVDILERALIDAQRDNALLRERLRTAHDAIYDNQGDYAGINRDGLRALGADGEEEDDDDWGR